MGLKKVLVTHAEFPSQSLTGDEQKALVDEGALIEHCFTTTYTKKAAWETAFANIRKSGVAHTVISTDLGQTINPPVAEGFAMFVQKLLDAGFTPDDVRTMAVTMRPATCVGVRRTASTVIAVPVSGTGGSASTTPVCVSERLTTCWLR